MGSIESDVRAFHISIFKIINSSPSQDDFNEKPLSKILSAITSKFLQNIKEIFINPLKKSFNENLSETLQKYVKVCQITNKINDK